MIGATYEVFPFLPRESGCRRGVNEEKLEIWWRERSLRDYAEEGEAEVVRSVMWLPPEVKWFDILDIFSYQFKQMIANKRKWWEWQRLICPSIDNDLTKAWPDYELAAFLLGPFGNTGYCGVLLACYLVVGYCDLPHTLSDERNYTIIINIPIKIKQNSIQRSQQARPAHRWACCLQARPDRTLDCKNCAG